VFNYPELNCKWFNKLEVDFEERKEFGFIMDFLKAKKSNAQLRIQMSNADTQSSGPYGERNTTLNQAVNEEHAIISFYHLKYKYEKELEDRDREKKRRVQQDKIDRLRRQERKKQRLRSKIRHGKGFSGSLPSSGYKDVIEFNFDGRKEADEEYNNKPNMFVNNMTAIQKSILNIDRHLLEHTSKTVKNISKFVDEKSKLMVLKDKEDQKDKRAEKQKVNIFIKRHSKLIQSIQN